MNLKYSAPLELFQEKQLLLQVNCQSGVLCITECNSIYPPIGNQVVFFFNFVVYGVCSIFEFIKLVYFRKQDDSYFRIVLVFQRPLR